jgi:hypothetical protein
MPIVGHLHQGSLCEDGSQHTVTVLSAGIGGTKPDPKETVILPDGILRGLHAHKYTSWVASGPCSITCGPGQCIMSVLCTLHRRRGGAVRQRD